MGYLDHVVEKKDGSQVSWIAGFEIANQRLEMANQRFEMANQRLQEYFRILTARKDLIHGLQRHFPCVKCILVMKDRMNQKG